MPCSSRTSVPWSTSPSRGRQSPWPAFFKAMRRSILVFSTTSSGKGLESHFPAVNVANVVLSEAPGNFGIDSERPCFRVFLNVLAMSSSGRFRLFGFHLPGEGRPAPSMKVFTMPFRCGFSVGPWPHQPSPRCGRRTPGSSVSSSEVSSSTALPGPPSSSESPNISGMLSSSRSTPSMSGRSMPFSSMRLEASSISAMLTSSGAPRMSRTEMSPMSSAVLHGILSETDPP